MMQRKNLLVLLLWVSAVAEEPAPAPDAAAPATAELLSVTVERSRALVEIAGQSPGARRARGPSRLLLRVRVQAAAKTGQLSLGAITVAGRFDDPAATALARLPSEEGGDPEIFRDASDEHVIVEVPCALPPEEARAIVDLQVSLQLPDPSGTPHKAYRVLEDVRAREGQDLQLAGEAEAWYRVEDFGAKTMTLRRMSAKAPPLADVRVTNTRGDVLERNQLASSEIQDPGGGGWVAILVFNDHVPLVVNLLVPTEVPAMSEVVATATRVELP